MTARLLEIQLILITQKHVSSSACDCGFTFLVRIRTKDISRRREDASVLQRSFRSRGVKKGRLFCSRLCYLYITFHKDMFI